MDHSRSTALLAAFVLSSCVFAMGCSATIGPYVTDIQQNMDGDLVVTRCSTEVSRAGNVDSYETKDCTQKVLPYPRTARGGSGSGTVEMSTTPPAKSGGTLVGP